MLSSQDSACSALVEIHIAVAKPIETSPTSPEAFGLKTKQSRDTVDSLRRLVHLRQRSHQFKDSSAWNEQ